MKFDTVIIGGGLAGLICGIRLLQHGHPCVIVSSGQSALHFSSGSFDLLNRLPDGTPVTQPTQAVAALVAQSPTHPYAKVGVQRFGVLAQQAEALFAQIGIELHGSAQQNHYRISPIGLLKPAWLTMANFVTSPSPTALPWTKAAIFHVAGFMDFYPRFVAHELQKMGVASQTCTFDHLHHSPQSLRTATRSQLFEKETNLDKLAQLVTRNSQGCDVVLLPDMAGLKNIKAHACLQEKVNKPVFLVATMPPSATGIYLQKQLRNHFVHLGGTFMLGDVVQKVDFEGHQIARVYSYNHGNIPFTGTNYVLATGSYFSKGLVANNQRMVEPIFDLDVTQAPDRKDWYAPHLFEKQNYLGYGVQTNASFKALRKGQPIDNLYVAGAILEGFQPIKEGSGAGVSVVSALAIANQIIPNKPPA